MLRRLPGVFAAGDVAHGARLYSIGNPHDLGISIVEGTHNGLLRHTLYPRIHFTGPINPGMSGGPTITPEGAVVGSSSLRRQALIRRLRPDVVNPHLFRSTLVAAPLARWCGARAVVETYHGREGWRRGPLRGRFLPDRAIARLLDRVIAVSEAARAFLIRSKGYPADRVVVVLNGRDLSVYRPGDGREAVRRALGPDRAVPLVGVVGRLETQKVHTYLLDAWPQVRREFPDARLLVVGDGSLRADLEASASAPALHGSVVFHFLSVSCNRAAALPVGAVRAMRGSVAPARSAAAFSTVSAEACGGSATTKRERSGVRDTLRVVRLAMRP